MFYRSKIGILEIKLYPSSLLS